MSQPRLLVLGAVGTRWLFGVAIASALTAWASETWLGVIAPSDRIAYPTMAAAFTVLFWLAWTRPHRLRHWQRWAVTLMALYFTLSMLAFTLRAAPGPSLYTLASFAPWTLAGCLLLFTTWRAAQALCISMALLALMMAPPTLLRFAGHAPQWLVDAWPLLANLALCQAMFCTALWGLSRQIARLVQLAPAGSGLVTANELVKSRMAELERSQAAAEAASRAKSEFLASVGHEIRTPMNTVLGQTRLLLAGRLAPEQRQQLHEVARAGESLVKLIDGLLDYSDLDAGRMPLADEPVRLEDLVGGAIDAVRQAAQAKQLELLCDIAPALLGRAGARRGDPRRLTQLITELLVNAVKFTATGQVSLAAGLRHDGAWHLRVRDSGVGLTPEQLARLFTPFAQAEANASRRYGGTGLGLAICRALVERMGGTLTARSTPGRGSEFELTLPLPPSAELPPPAPQLDSILIVQATHSAGHEGLVSLVKAMAPTARVDVLNQGHQALALLQSPLLTRAHELMLVDWVLPDMDGIALLQQLADAGLPDIRRVAVLSAFDTPVLRERALRHGAHVLVAKPLLPQTLRRLLDLQRPLPIAPQTRSEAPGTPADACDRTTLIGEFDALLGEADSEAVTLWEQHGSAVLDMLPAAQAKALAGAMQRFDFDAAQAALRRGRTP